MTIAEFVAARLDESERDAGNIHDRQTDAYLDSDLCVCEYPARVLAQVVAMRAIVDAYDRAYHGDHIDETVWEQSRRESLDNVLHHLAAIWSDHPDHDPAWAPEGE